MRKQLIPIGFTLLLLFHWSCKKNNTEPETVMPYLGGKVVLINSDTPVPNALVRFLKWQQGGGLFDPMVYVEVASDTTDESGHFDIPTGSDATMAIAYGPIAIYSQESVQGDLQSYWNHGGEMKLELRPPAWIKVSALDMEPLNPEISYLEGRPNTGETNVVIVPLTDAQTWKVDGNVSQYVSYRSVYIDNAVSTIMHYEIPPPSPFDTTEFIIPY